MERAEAENAEIDGDDEEDDGKFYEMPFDELKTSLTIYYLFSDGLKYDENGDENDEDKDENEASDENWAGRKDSKSQYNRIVAKKTTTIEF